MECVFVEISLWADEYVVKEAADVFAELEDVEDFHGEGGLI